MPAGYLHSLYGLNVMEKFETNKVTLKSAQFGSFLQMPSFNSLFETICVSTLQTLQKMSFPLWLKKPRIGFPNM